MPTSSRSIPFYRWLLVGLAVFWSGKFQTAFAEERTRPSGSTLKTSAAWSELPPDNHQCREQKIVLQKPIAGEVLTIDWSLINDSEEFIDFHRVYSSCGCISSLPSAQSVDPKSEIHHTLKFEIPNTTGDFGKTISFFNQGGICLYQLALTGDAISPLSHEDILTLDDDTKRTIKLSVFPSKESVRLKDYSLTIYGSEVESSEWRIDDEQNAKVILNIDPTKNPKASSSSLQAEVTKGGGVKARYQVQLLYTHRITTLPERLLLRRVEQALEGKIVVVGRSFAEAILQGKGLVATSLDANHQKIDREVSVSAEADAEKPTLTIIRVRLPNAVEEVPNPTNIRFECGNIRFESKCEIARP